MSEDVRTLYINNLNERIRHHRLRHEIGELCKNFGPVTAVYTSRAIRKRGQAFIAFENSRDAAEALKGLQDKELFKKPMRVAFSHSMSDCQVNADAVAERKKRRNSRRESPAPENHGEDPEGTKRTPSPTETEDKPKKSFGEPNNTLLLQQIPDHITVDDLRSICGSYAGFSDARMFAVRHVGFLEFDSIDAAVSSIDQLSEQNIGKVTYAKK